MWFKAQAPGSLMLLGEYAVLNGGNALVAAINHRMTVKLSPRNDSKIKITSQLGELEIDISTIDIQKPFQFVLTVLKKHQSLLPSGCDIIIESEFSDQMGYASSAAVTVALLSALHAWLDQTITHEAMILKAREIVRDVQGIGSGADVAACVLGGVVAYRAEPFKAEKIFYDYPITVIYSGSKTKTVDAIAYVKKHFATQPELFQKILHVIDACAIAGIQAARDNNHAELGKIMNIQQGLMESLGVNNAALDRIVKMLQQDSKTLGAKISGSGLGDCAVGLGSSLLSPVRNGAEIAPLGVTCEKV